MIADLKKLIRHWLEALSSLWVLFSLKRKQRAYLKLLKQSGMFDRDFYRQQNPQLFWLYLYLSERHYIVQGEDVGLFPNSHFSPKAYLRLNPAAMRSNQPPLLHYLTLGRLEDAPTRDPSPIDEVDKAPLPKMVPKPRHNRFAAVVHVYYVDLWEELDEQLQRSGLSFDRFITITNLGAESQALAAKIRQRYPADQVWLMPNHGRDIFPWVALINAGVLAGYEAVCKLHSKRSPHLKDGGQWRASLLYGLLPPKQTRALVEAFLADQHLGMLVTKEQHLIGAKWWGANQSRACELLARAGMEVDPAVLNFAAGSMFWAKPHGLAWVAKLELDAHDFELEQGGTDGSTAHAFERMMGYILSHIGQRIATVESLRA